MSFTRKNTEITLSRPWDSRCYHMARPVLSCDNMASISLFFFSLIRWLFENHPMLISRCSRAPHFFMQSRDTQEFPVKPERERKYLFVNSVLNFLPTVALYTVKFRWIPLKSWVCGWAESLAMSVAQQGCSLPDRVWWNQKTFLPFLIELYTNHVRMRRLIISS